MNILRRIQTVATHLVEEVKAARAQRAEPIEIQLPTYGVRTAGTDEVIELPKMRTFDHEPTQDELLAEARRMALEYARARTGKPELTWRQAKLAIDKWEKEERAVERERDREARQQPAHIATVNPNWRSHV